MDKYMKKINIIEKFSKINKYWDPKIVGELNGQQVKLVKFKGEFDWHKHDHEDELFMVINGTFDLNLKEQKITLCENEMIVVPRGTEHCPSANEEVSVLLFEPVSTINTGDKRTEKTIVNPDKI